MKRRQRPILLGVGALAAMAIALHLWLIDGIGGWAWGALFKEDTVYAAGYTDNGWRMVRVGMTEDDIRGLIGQPLQVWTNEDATVGMRWSRSPGDTHYRCRVLQFRDHKVAEKHSEFYVD